MSQSLAALENGGVRRAVHVRGFALLLLSFQTLGVIYSDIGTSPLYVLNGIWPSSGPLPSEEDIIGGISAIVWSLTLLPLVKYVFICLNFGTGEGEGGTFALFQGLYPRKEHDPEFERSLTKESIGRASRTSSAKISPRLRWPVLIWCLLGTSLTLADGIFTPAVSVTSAVGGIAVAKASVQSKVTPISIAFLLALFLVQPFGTARLASVFAPVTSIWLLLLGATGIVNIVAHPGICRAFDPSRAVLLFVRTRDYDLLAGVLLAVTGCEAVFANLGQFNMASIRISFSFFVYPCLLLAYLGQGARLIRDGDAVFSNIFYQTIPGDANGPLFWILYVFAILATLIASQAMITATFSLVQQLVNMKSLPPIRMVHTSEKIQGQVFIPSVNWILMILIIVVVAAFKSSTALTDAYGFAVATVMFSTTILIAVHMRYVKYWPMVIGLAYLVGFGFFDGLFWGAALRKIPAGAWVPLMIGVILMILMAFWTWAKGLEDAFDGANRRSLRRFVVTNPGSDGEPEVLQVPRDDIAARIDDSITMESSQSQKVSAPTTYYLAANESYAEKTVEYQKLARIPTCAVFHKLTGGKGVPHSFVAFVRQWPALPEVIIFLSVRVIPTARIAPEDRYVVDKVRSVDGFYAATYNLGFREDFDVKIDEIIEQICTLEARVDPENASERVKWIRQAAATPTHIVPGYHVMSRRLSGGGPVPALIDWLRALLIDSIYRPLLNMFPDTANWSGSADEIIRVGVNATI
ncbi:potassium transporter [Neolentinus lepideus HHB14362 ss-1]|uniref:Potassium transporter n=1 Tax=Neolentinus lepideus HHB14362 ss-1 TaxID=1314782 RepID=A0A165PGV6_9AGAM|nr:potassium transporter [Neolentinus lepideus HHB14362 ss-1]